MRVLLGLILWLMAAGAGWAEQSVETRFGTVRIIEIPLREGFTREAFEVAGEAMIPFAEEYDIGIGKVINWGKRGDVVIVSGSSGGQSCCTSYGIFHLTADGVRYHNVNNVDAIRVGDFVVAKDVIHFRVYPHPDFAPVTYDHGEVSYDGKSVQLTDVFEQDEGSVAAGAGVDVTKWRGSWAVALFKDASERARFRQIMTAEELDSYRSDNLNDRFDEEVVDGFLFGGRCASPTYIRLLALEVATGKPYVAKISQDQRLIFGPEGEVLPIPVENRISDCLGPQFGKEGAALGGP